MNKEKIIDLLIGGVLFFLLLSAIVAALLAANNPHRSLPCPVSSTETVEIGGAIIKS